MPENETWIEYVVIAGYLAALVGLGFAFKRFNSGVSDYFRSGCRASWWLVGSSAFMQMFSAWTFTGAAGAAFEAGWSVMVIFFANVLVFFLVFLFLGPWFRQLRAITAPEVIRLRFGPGTQQLYAWLQGILGLLYAAVWLWGLATFTASVFNLEDLAAMVNMGEVQFVIAMTGLVVLVYSVTGGAWAVFATDFVQSLILVPLTILVAYLCLQEVGGVGGLFSEIESQGLTEEFALIKADDAFPLGKYGLAFACAVVWYKAISYSTLLTAQKYFGVKDGNEARKAGLLACVLMMGGMLIWFIPPMVARLTMPDTVNAVDLTKPAEASYALIAVKVLPVGMTGLMVVAMLAATMSSMDSGLNKNAAVFVRDIEPLLRKIVGYAEPSDRTQFRVGQVVSVLLGCAIIGLALYFSGVDGRGVFEWMLNIGALVALPLAIPMMLALFIRRAPAWSAAVSVGVALIPSTAGFFAGKPFLVELTEGTALAGVLGAEWSYQAKVFINSGVGIATFLLTIPAWRFASSAYREQVDEFFTRMRTPVDFETEVGQANDGGQLRVVGSFSIAIGVLILSLCLLPDNDWAGRGAIIFVGGFVAIVGAILLVVGKRNTPPTSTDGTDASNTQEPFAPPPPPPGDPR